MAKAKGGSSDLEYYRGKLREKEKEIKKLKSELSRYQKRERQVDNLEETAAELALEVSITKASKKDKSDCPECQSGQMTIIDLGSIRKIHKCLNCGWSKVTK